MTNPETLAQKRARANRARKVHSGGRKPRHVVPEWMADLPRDAVLAAVREKRATQTQAARALGVSRQAIHAATKS